MDQREEVRLAIALNGGVSLAIWMGGCAVELDAARRAHLGVDDLGEGRERGVYTGICNALNRRLVIDVMAGSSAGGINAALLASATVAETRLHPDFIREQWIGLGDIAGLLHPSANAEPHSLLQGQKFHTSLQNVFESIGVGEGMIDERNRLTDDQLARQIRGHDYEYGYGYDVVPKIDITATDLAGDEQSFEDMWGSSLSARDYRARFRFRDRGDYEVDKLAAAARSSASFPGAFEPWWPGDAVALAELGASRWMIDGGLLDNAPIRAALDLIPRQPARAPVRRLLCYLNPDPALEGDGGFLEGSSDVKTSPKLDAVLGRSMKILRAADFVNHLRAIQRAVQPESTFEQRELPLLRMDLGALELTAAALAPTYRAERARLSVEELTGAPPTPRELSALLSDGGVDLPWLPVAGQQSFTAWTLGIRAAQRALHLGVDILRRGAISEAAAQVEEAVQIDELVAELDETHEGATSDPGLSQEVKQSLDTDAMPADAQLRLDQDYGRSYERPALAALYHGASLLYDALTGERNDLWGAELGYALFGGDGSGSFGAEQFEHFVRRMSAIEIVKRAFAGERTIETSEPISFAQLTPFTDCPILDCSFLGHGPHTPEQKLTGIRLGHFAAFYRASWRVNDYMWGRLDAAARIVDMLFDGVEVNSGTVNSETLVEAILPDDAGEDLRWAIHEGLWGFGEVPDRDELADLLRTTIDAEIAATAPGELAPLPRTRALCVRALQFEILADELPRLLEEAEADERMGAGTAAPAIEGDSTAARIRSLRELDPLPTLLGRDSAAEGTSDLALRTSSKAAFVALSAVRAMQKPLGRTLGLVRPALYALAGVVSRSRVSQAAVVLGFFAATAFLASRSLVIDGNAEIAPSDLVAKWNLVGYISALFVLGVAAPPLIRFGARVQRIPNALLGAGILLSAGMLAALPRWGPLEAICGDLGLRWLLAPITSDTDQILPEELMFAILLVTVGVVAGAWPAGKLLERLKAPLTRLFERSWAGAPTMLALLAVSAASLVFTVPELLSELADPLESWRFGVALAPLIGTAVVGFLLLLTAGPGGLSEPEQDFSVTLGGVQFTSVSYSSHSDLLRLETPTAGASDDVLWISDERDCLRGTLGKGVTTIEIAQAAARVAAGGTFMTFERPFSLSVGASDVARAIAAAKQAPARRPS